MMPPAVSRGRLMLVPGDDRHQIVIVLAGEAPEVGVELSVAGIDGEGEVVATLTVLLLPDAVFEFLKNCSFLSTILMLLLKTASLLASIPFTKNP